MKAKQAEPQKPFHKEYGLKSNLLFILGLLKRYDPYSLFLILLGAIIAPFYRYLWTFLSKYVIDVITGNGQANSLIVVILIFTCAQIVITLANTYVESDFWWRFIDVRMRAIMQLNRKAMTIDFEHLENPDVMDCHRKAQNAAGSNNQGVEGMMHQTYSFCTSLMVVLAGILILGTMNLYLVLLMLALALVNFMISNYINKTSKREVWDRLAPWWRKNYYMADISTDFSAAKDIRMFGLRDWMLSKFRELNVIRYEAQRKNARLWSCVVISGAVLWALCQVFTYWWLIRSVLAREITVGNFSLYLASSATFFSYISTLLSQVSEFLARSREVDDFRSFMDFEGNSADDNLLEVPKSETYEFAFENVSFRYPRAEHYALKHLNLTLRAGERLAVVGLNGAGKTTMIKLLLRLYEPTEGRILLNGVDVRSYKKESYYAVFAPVFQDVHLFAFPISQNVSMQSPEATDAAKASDCLIQAGMEEKLSSLSQGVNTQLLKVIYDDGIDLSGGEKQKLALARALYKDAPVIVLDEPTAALDALAEAKLYEEFNQLIGHKTAVYISHRLSSTQFCNAVAMFADGEMKEYGTHEELMQKNGAYAELFRVQAQYYVEEA